jgi:hypothetical protein
LENLNKIAKADTRISTSSKDSQKSNPLRQMCQNFK